MLKNEFNIKLPAFFRRTFIQKMWRVFHFAIPSIATFFLLSCKNNGYSGVANEYEPTYSSKSDSVQVLTLGVPSLNFYQLIQPTIKYLNSRLHNIEIKAMACNGLHEYKSRYYNHEFDITMINGNIALAGDSIGYRVIGKLGEDNMYKAVILVAKNSGIQSLKDLKGSVIAFPGEESLAGAMMPIMYLHKQGMNINKDFSPLYLPSVESCFKNLYLGKCKAAATWIGSWNIFCKQEPEIASKLEAKWETPTLTSIAVLIKSNLNQAAKDSVLKLLFNMHKDSEGQTALQLLSVKRIYPASIKDYQPVRDFMKEFETIERK